MWPITFEKLKTSRTLFGSLTHLISLLLGLQLGFWIFLYVSAYPAFSFIDKIALQVDPLSAFLATLTLLVTVVLAVYVSRVLSKKDEGERLQREYLVSYFKAFEADLGKMVRKYALGGAELKNVTPFLKRSGMRAETLVRLAVEARYLAKDSSTVNQLREVLKTIRELLTLTPREGQIEDGVRFSEGKLNYSEAQVDKIAEAVFRFEEAVFKLTAEINQ